MASSVRSDNGQVRKFLELDEAQSELRDLPIDSSAVVFGAPGTGKTTSLIARFETLLKKGLKPDQILVLTPSRVTATSLRSELAFASDVTSTSSLARSFAAIAFELVSKRHAELEDHELRLLSGGEEDLLIAKLLADDASSKQETMRWPANFSAEMLASPQFRSQLRAVFYQCIELGISSERLTQLAAEYEQPVWSALASFMPRYYALRAEQAPQQRDVASMMLEATKLLLDPNYRLPGKLSQLKAVLCDDLQACSAGELDFISALERRGLAVIVFVDPDSVTSSFRGAPTRQLKQLLDAIQPHLVLPVIHRCAPVIVDQLRTIVERIGVSGYVAQRHAYTALALETTAVTEEQKLQVVELKSELDEAAVIAKRLRERHLIDAVAWRDCAVIAHDSRQLQLLAKELIAASVPVYLQSQPELLSQRAAARELLNLIAFAQATDESSEAEKLAAMVLRGRFCGLDFHQQRQLRRKIASQQHEYLPANSPRRQMLQALGDPAKAQALADDFPFEPGFKKIVSTSKAVAKVREESADATAQELLWAAWSAGNKAEEWGAAAAKHDTAGARANEDLDAVVALFEAAKRFDESELTASGWVFIDRMLNQTIVDDQLDAKQRYQSVSLLTPEAALGMEFDTVIIAGIQKGVWPNLKPRGELFAANDLSVLATKRSGENVVLDDELSKQQQTRFDELRLLLRASSRAKKQLIVTAVNSEDTVPSAFFRLFPEAEKISEVLPFELRTRVAQLRRKLSAADQNPEQKSRAAKELAILAASGVSGAAVSQWYGMAGETSTQPLLSEPEITVSASQMMSFDRCALDWAVTQTSGPRTPASSAAYGTLIHSLLEQFLVLPERPNTFAQTHEFFKQAWADQRDQLPNTAPWLAQTQEALAQHQILALAKFLVSVSDDEIIGSETEFSANLGQLPAVENTAIKGLSLRGKIDLILQNKSGDFSIIDLKTSASSGVTDKAVHDNLQLHSYQLAAALGAVPGVTGPVKAGLLVLRDGSVKDAFSEASQSPLQAEELAAVQESIKERAISMSAETFFFEPHLHCTNSNAESSRSCRVHAIEYLSEGR